MIRIRILLIVIGIALVANFVTAETLDEVKLRVMSYAGMRTALEVARISGNVALSNALLKGSKVTWNYDKADNQTLYVLTPTGEMNFRLSDAEKTQFSRLFLEYTCSHQDASILIQNYTDVRVACGSQKNYNKVRDHIRESDTKIDSSGKSLETQFALWWADKYEGGHGVKHVANALENMKNMETNNPQELQNRQVKFLREKGLIVTP